MSFMTRVRDALKGATATKGPSAAFFQGGRNPLMASWNPSLREHQDDIRKDWEKAAARAVEGVQNSGFLTKVVETETGSVVGAGLRLSSRPDGAALGLSPEATSKLARQIENEFRIYSNSPIECDAGGRMTFGKMQQAAFASYKCYGEVLALLPKVRRPGSRYMSKIALLPPLRLAQKNDETENIVQGVRCDRDWGFPTGYVIKRKDRALGWQEVEIAAFDRDGAPQVIHVFDASLGVTRGISPLAPVLKVVRQVDQFADATLTTALLQTIFAATMKTNIPGLAGFDGLMTGKDRDSGILDMEAFAAAKGEWYDGAKIDLTQHGRIAQLFPGDELIFNESKVPGAQLDQFMGWLMREIAAGAGVTYESATGDYRGATYSSIRMAGAIEWLNVIRRRQNIIVPFCQSGFEAFMDEAVFTGRVKFPGGYSNFLAKREAACRASWSGPAQPQADDFKAARSHEVLKDMGATTLMEISASYGRDWDDDMRQRAEENRLAEELDLPLPWAPTDPLQTRDGQELALNAPPAGEGEKKDTGNRKKSTRKGADDPAERDPADVAEDELQADVESSDGD
jgi:lambda family phage portal protein